MGSETNPFSECERIERARFDGRVHRSVCVGARGRLARLAVARCGTRERGERRVRPQSRKGEEKRKPTISFIVLVEFDAGTSATH